ncbi:MAG: polysaccharide biosynthesis/export family protein [Waddliaceae bacterium]
MKRLLLPIFSVILLSSCCCPPPNCDFQVTGPDEFVIDSCQIKQGKQAILAMMGEYPGAFPMDALDEYENMIGEGDILSINVYHPTRKDLREAFDNINKNMGGFTVNHGYINFPNVQPVYVEGLTLEEARALVQQKLQDEIQDVEVYITYKDRLRNRVELTGMVGTSFIPVDGKIRLYDLISQARIDIKKANWFKSYVMRDGIPLAVDIHKLIYEGDMNHNIVMRGGDKVFIADLNESPVIVLGEVNLPTAVPAPNGYITLPEAIVAARGIPFTGDNCHIQIIRGDLECPKIYVISWSHIVHLPNESMLLMPGDTVYVSEKPITEWNRFISQLLPSLFGVRDFRMTYNLLSH